MKLLRDLWLIQTKPGAASEFHYVLLMNPNAAVKSRRGQGRVQDMLYARVLERIAEVSGFGEIEFMRQEWQRIAPARMAAAAQEAPPPTSTGNGVKTTSSARAFQRRRSP